MDAVKVNDFTELTCTNLMIKLKIMLNRLPPGDALAFFATREQVDNTCAPFSTNGYQVAWEEEAENRYMVRIGK
ncbi:MAG: hypothetical protein LLF84_08520 [Methanoregulaceae archaeon]|nr:hypothetical protein [Methanoregulaceae archaeon]